MNLLYFVKITIFVILNVLPCEYYAKDNIPGSYNLPYNTIGKNEVCKI